MRRLSSWVWVIAGGVTLGLLALASGYGFHRDELYFIVAGRHPALGYVDQPPLTPFLTASAAALLGPTPLAIRILPALSAGVVIAMTADMARRFGGGPAAQVTAAVAMATTGLLAVGHLASTTTFDILAWTVVLWFVVRLLDGADPRLWLGLGVAAGLGLDNKYTIAFLGVGLIVGILVARRWDVVRSAWAWAGLTLAVVIWLPNLVWQAANGWPQLDMARILAARALAERDSLVAELVLIGGSLMVWVPLVGFGWLVVAGRAKAWRTIGWAAAVVVGLVLWTSGKSYYVAGLLPVLVAAGAVPVGGWIERGRTVARPLAVGVPALLAGAVMAILTLPVVPAASLASTPITDVYGEAGEQLGWPELVDGVRSAVEGLSPAERARAVILTANYGEAGAVEVLGRDLPPTYSGHNSYWDWGPPPDGSLVAIVVAPGSWRPAAVGDCEVSSRVDNGVDVANDEQGTAILLCRRLPDAWDQFWPGVRHLD